jgi:putative addiction module CopG family antidote
MNINLPDSITPFVEEQVTIGKYPSVAEYLVELIEADRRRSIRAQIEAEIRRGIESGPSTPLDQEEWRSIREEVIARHRRRSQTSEGG